MAGRTKENSRRSKAAAKRARKAAVDAAKGSRDTPNDHVQRLRQRFAFLRLEASEGRQGTIDQDICDGIGQMCAVGLLDGHGHDPLLLRDTGREWGEGFALWYKSSGMKTASYVRMDRSDEVRPITRAEERFRNLNNALSGYEKSCLLSLIVDPLIGHFEGDGVVFWAASLIGERLLEMGIIPPVVRFPTPDDWFRHGAAIRGLCQLVDASLPARRMAA